MKTIKYFFDKTTDEELANAYHAASSVRNLILSFGCKSDSQPLRLALKARLDSIALSFDKLAALGKRANQLAFGGAQSRCLPNEEVFCLNSPIRGRGLKSRILSQSLKQNKCNICPLGPEWKGKPLVLVLDHINGDSNDNRLENLQFLCPNCNSQTDTFCRRKGVTHEN